LITSNALDHWRQPVESESKPTFSRIGKRSLEGTLDTSGVSRMVLHQILIFIIKISPILTSGTISRKALERVPFCFGGVESQKVRFHESQKQQFFKYYRTFDLPFL